MYKIKYYPSICHYDTKMKSFWRKFFISAVLIPFLCFSIVINFAGCFYNGSAPKNLEKQIEKMRSEAHKKAQASLMTCNIEKDILKIMGFRAVEKVRHNWVGSGFIVQYNNRQYLVSATHVVLKDSYFQLYKNNIEQPYEIDKWIGFDDSSLIRLKTNTFTNPFEVDMEFASTLQERLHAEEKIECIAYGFAPQGLRKTEGYILSIYTDVETKAQYIISSNPIVSGMSGGVLTTKEGKAIGVISAYVNGPDQWGMYLPISNLINAIESKLEPVKKKP